MTTSSPESSGSFSSRLVMTFSLNGDRNLLRNDTCQHEAGSHPPGLANRERQYQASTCAPKLTPFVSQPKGLVVVEATQPALWLTIPAFCAAVFQFA